MRIERHDNLLTSAKSDLDSLAGLRPSVQGGTVRHLRTLNVSDYLIMLGRKWKECPEMCPRRPCSWIKGGREEIVDF